MTNENKIKERQREHIRVKLEKIMQCLCSGEQRKVDEMVPSSKSVAVQDYSASLYSSQAGETERKPDTGNIEEAETSLRESGCLNYEEARALLGRYEYQKGNLEAALHVFEGIDIAAVTPKMKITLAARGETRKRRMQNYATPPMSIHAVSLLLESIFLKAKSFQALGRNQAVMEDVAFSNILLDFPVGSVQCFMVVLTFVRPLDLVAALAGHTLEFFFLPYFVGARWYCRPTVSVDNHSLESGEPAYVNGSLICVTRHLFAEAAQSCSVILDIVESSLPEGLPENFGADCKLQETLTKAVELLPELWKLVESPRESILSYRRALLHQWNLDTQTLAKIQKEFAIFLLYSGAEAIPPNLRSHIDRSFVPKNNTEEAILLLIILLRKASLMKIELDPSILDHLTYALSVSGGLQALANQLEELLPEVLDWKERYDILALCHHSEGNELDALDCWKKLLKSHSDSTDLRGLLFASKTCGETSKHIEDGISFARRAVKGSHRRCDQLAGVAHCMLGISLSLKSGSVLSDSERVERQSEALAALETAGRMTKLSDPISVYHLCLQYAEQRKLDSALHHAKCLVKLEGGSNLKGWILLARILSADKRYLDAETIVNAALDQTGVWNQGELLRTKAMLQIAQGLMKEAIETFSRLLAVLQVQSKSFPSEKKRDGRNHHMKLEMDTWHDLASIYISLSQWQDAEICLSKSKAISTYCASRLHISGLLHEAKGQNKEALKSYEVALEVDPTHVPSLVSKATLLRKIGCLSPAIMRSILTEALRHDRTNISAWYNLGLLYKDGGGSSSAAEAAECFKAAAFLEETAPVESFR
ncbi:calmodulin binding protein [Dorcoceras hygrometricum]|uniref:Calmodulin binding protein n=1 Tax=Dorcoceras hygrometricum TaxID=472368 RepID=A0A2Z7BHQ5_9LAMI|nr:calmodulin binding protein [Dorcoceras hygrometricum]